MTEQPEKIAQQWLDACCETLARYDHEAHMNLISRSVRVFGVPGFEVIGYDDWHAQSEYEFGEKLIQSASYEGLELLNHDPEHIRFVTTETIAAVDGTVDSHPIEILLTREQDGQWRVTEERLLNRGKAGAGASGP